MNIEDIYFLEVWKAVELYVLDALRGIGGEQ